MVNCDQSEAIRKKVLSSRADASRSEYTIIMISISISIIISIIIIIIIIIINQSIAFIHDYLKYSVADVVV